jgi:murein DD-endopeptidase MepM/ murein hydrolase activator NlpD
MPTSSFPSSQDAATWRTPARRPGGIARKLLVWILLLLAASVFGLREYERNPEPWRAAWKRLLLPFRLAKLQIQPPDEALAMPVRGATLRSVRDTWHAARPGDRRHEGQDIFAPRGTPVVSSTRGVVTRVGENTLGGKVVFVAGAGARSYYYAHLDAWAESLSAGDWVEPGTVLGYTGTTGNARGTPPHLHFGVYGAGGAIDPYPMLAAGLARASD